VPESAGAWQVNIRPTKKKLKKVQTQNYQLYSYSINRQSLTSRLLTDSRHYLRWLRRGVYTVFALLGMAFCGVYLAMHFGLLDVRGSIAARDQFYGNLTKIVTPTASSTCTLSVHDCAWENTQEWSVINAGLAKDASEINLAANQTDVSPRMIAAAVVPEQIRYFTSEREVFKEYFEPLKILGSMSEFSLGVAGIKQQTASDIENYAGDINSAFYPGPGYAGLISYGPNQSRSALQFERLTSNDHYYDYLYVGLFIREIETQWLKKGYDISERPDVVTTLYNIGFAHSQPKADPQMGGATVEVGGQAYSFGELGTLFYNSSQLNSVFPRP
jgi:hypothetical protein